MLCLFCRNEYSVTVLQKCKNGLLCKMEVQEAGGWRGSYMFLAVLWKCKNGLLWNEMCTVQGTVGRRGMAEEIKELDLKIVHLGITWITSWHSSGVIFYISKQFPQISSRICGRLAGNISMESLLPAKSATQIPHHDLSRNISPALHFSLLRANQLYNFRAINFQTNNLFVEILKWFK